MVGGKLAGGGVLVTVGVAVAGLGVGGTLVAVAVADGCDVAVGVAATVGVADATVVGVADVNAVGDGGDVGDGGNVVEVAATGVGLAPLGVPTGGWLVDGTAACVGLLVAGGTVGAMVTAGIGVDDAGSGVGDDVGSAGVMRGSWATTTAAARGVTNGDVSENSSATISEIMRSRSTGASTSLIPGP